MFLAQVLQENLSPSLKNLLKTMKRGKDSIFASSKHPKPLIFLHNGCSLLAQSIQTVRCILTFIKLNQVLLKLKIVNFT